MYNHSGKAAQSLCYHTAIALQSHCNRNRYAITTQLHCNQSAIAIAAQSLRNHSAITTQSLKGETEFRPEKKVEKKVKVFRTAFLDRLTAFLEGLRDHFKLSFTEIVN
jgi:hypothetical protein